MVYATLHALCIYRAKMKKNEPSLLLLLLIFFRYCYISFFFCFVLYIFHLFTLPSALRSIHALLSCFHETNIAFFLHHFNSCCILCHRLCCSQYFFHLFCSVQLLSPMLFRCAFFPSQSIYILFCSSLCLAPCHSAH